jgi:preprotein translocase subunit SecG
MLNVLIVIHLLLAVAMVGVILLQRSEGGALGIGGGGGGLMSGRAAGNLLTRATGILAAGFFLTSLGLALLSNNRGNQGSIMDAPIGTPQQQQAPQQPQAPQPQQPQAPAAPISH